MERNKSIHRSDEQKNLYKALVNAYESDKLILDSYGDNVLFKRCRDDEDKVEEPSTGSNRGSKRRRAGKELESNPVTIKRKSPSKTTADLHESFKELMDTPLDFSAFVMNRLKVDTLTPELLAGPTFELMKGSCKSLITGISNGLKIWSLTQCGFKCRLATTNMHSRESYIGGENDNNSMDLLLIGNRLEMSTPNAESLLRVEDLQLGVESYQKKLNLTKSDTYKSDLKQMEAYSAYSNPRGFIYQNKDKKNRLMRIDELHKFSDSTLNDVRTTLDDHLKGIRMKYLPQIYWRQSVRDKEGAMIQAN
ncbi:hypothetical protein Tco_0009935 [Tanacetum coccineum]